jgi:hypothetical protein
LAHDEHDRDGNLTAACYRCNAQKGGKPLLHFLLWRRDNACVSTVQHRRRVPARASHGSDRQQIIVYVKRAAKLALEERARREGRTLSALCADLLKAADG